MRRTRLKGFTLIEVIIGIFLISLLSVALANSIFGLNLLTKNIESENETLISKNYGIDYIVNEIDSSQYAILMPISYMDKNKWIGFTLCKMDESSIKDKYTMITYGIKDRTLYRYSFKSAALPRSLSLTNFDGINPILNEVETFSGSMSENKLIEVLISFTDSDEIITKHVFKGKILYE